MLADMRHPAVKQAWVSDFPVVHPSDCYNCGAAGNLTLQTALAGPFRNTLGLGGELQSKSDVLNGQIVWWGVKTTSYPCPVCMGGKQFVRDEGKVTNPKIVEMAHDLAHEPAKQEELDWQQRKDINDSDD